MTIGRDSFWIAPHLMIYGSVVVGLALGWGVLAYEWWRGVPSTPGFPLAALGLVLVVLAGPIADLWHRLFGLDVTLWSPPHLLALFGSAVSTLGCLLIAVETYRLRSWAGRGALVLGGAVLYGGVRVTFDPTWLYAYSYGGVLFHAFAMLAALILPLALVTTARVSALRWAPVFAVVLSFALGLAGQQVARAGFAILQPVSGIEEAIASDRGSPVAVGRGIAEKNQAVPPPSWALRLALPLGPAALMALADPRRRPGTRRSSTAAACSPSTRGFSRPCRRTRRSRRPASRRRPRSRSRWRAAPRAASPRPGSPRGSSARRRSGEPGARAPRPPSHHRADDPGRELFLAHARQLALRALARRDRDHLFEVLTADRRDRRALEDDAAVDVHVLGHMPVHQRIGRELDRRHGLAAEHRAAPGREADDVAAAGDQPGDRHRIVARRVHEDEAARGDRLAVEEYVHHRRRAALRDAAEGFFKHRGDPSSFVTRSRVVVHRLDAAAVPLPPFVAVDELLGVALVDRAPDQEVLGAVDFGGLGQDTGAAVAHELVHRPAERWVGGHARVRVGAAAVGGERELGDRLGRAPRLVGEREELGDLLRGAVDCFPDSAGLLDIDDGRLALGMPRRGHPLALDHHRGLVRLAAQADQDVRGHVRVLGVAGEHAL